MTWIRALLLLLAVTRMASAFAGGDTSEDLALAQLSMRVAPLALSADGRTRVHVDSAHALHRVSLAAPSRDQVLALPPGVQAIAASRTAQKVAVLVSDHCAGLVDFGADGLHPTLRWLMAPATPGDAGKWVTDRADCATADTSVGWSSSPTLALSPDGRQLVVGATVIDADTGRVVASLRGVVVRARFVEGGKRLLVHSVVSAARDESESAGLSESVLGLWDVASGDLLALKRRRVGELDANTLALDARADAAWWVEESWPTYDPKTVYAPHPSLHRWLPGACGTGADVAVTALPSGHVRQLVVDPLARWVVFEMDPGWPGDESRFVATSLADGHVLKEWHDGEIPTGLVASPDGTRLFGLRHGVLVDLPIPVDGLRAAPLPSATSAVGQACAADGAAADTRKVARVERPLAKAWTRSWTPPVGPRPPADACPQVAPPGNAANVFFRPDGSLWVDRGSALLQLAPADGKELRSQPTPRTPTVCSVTGPNLPGWFNVQGDTLTLRDFQGTPASRRVLEQRRGWDGIELALVNGALRVVWKARPGTIKPAASESPQDLVIAFYDLAGNPVSQIARNADEYDFVGGAYELADEPFFLPACTDSAGRLVDVLDWRVDVFQGFRARACGGEGAPERTLMWTDSDIRPRPALAREAEFVRPAAVAHDGAIAVGWEDGQLRVFDIAQRRELGRVRLEGRLLGVAVSARERVVVAATSDHDAALPDSVTAWRLP